MRTANYVSVIAGRLAAKLPDCPADLLRLYALLVLTTGTATTLENVHDAWSAWRDASRPDHPSLVPFAELAADVQELDRKYADAIREVAGEMFGRLLTPAEVCALFRVAPETLRRWGRLGKIGSVRTLGGHKRYRESEIRAILAGGAS